jgi:hypothetical protein
MNECIVKQNINGVSICQNHSNTEIRVRVRIKEREILTNRPSEK